MGLLRLSFYTKAVAPQAFSYSPDSLPSYRCSSSTICLPQDAAALSVFLTKELIEGAVGLIYVDLGYQLIGGMHGQNRNANVYNVYI